MTELNLYEARTEDSEKVNLILITDKNDYVLARTRTDEYKRMKTVISPNKKLVLADVEYLKRVNLNGWIKYISEEMARWGVQHSTVKFGPVFIVRNQSISEERYVQWKEQFFREKENCQKNYQAIYTQLKRAIESLKKEAQAKTDKLQESASLERLLAN